MSKQHKTDMKIERETITGTGQCVRLHQVGSIGEYRVEIDIKSDSYKHQGRAIARVWSPRELKWNVVSSIDPLAMETDEKLGYKERPASASDFDMDRDTLLREVVFILKIA